MPRSRSTQPCLIIFIDTNDSGTDFRGITLNGPNEVRNLAAETLSKSLSQVSDKPVGRAAVTVRDETGVVATFTDTAQWFGGREA